MRVSSFTDRSLRQVASGFHTTFLPPTTTSPISNVPCSSVYEAKRRLLDPRSPSRPTLLCSKPPGGDHEQGQRYSGRKVHPEIARNNRLSSLAVPIEHRHTKKRLCQEGAVRPVPRWGGRDTYGDECPWQKNHGQNCNRLQRRTVPYGCLCNVYHNFAVLHRRLCNSGGLFCDLYAYLSVKLCCQVKYLYISAWIDACISGNPGDRTAVD